MNPRPDASACVDSAAMAFTYRSTADQRAVFADETRDDGRTLELDPGEKFVTTRKRNHRYLALVERKEPPRPVPSEEVTVPDATIEQPARPARP